MERKNENGRVCESALYENGVWKCAFEKCIFVTCEKDDQPNCPVIPIKRCANEKDHEYIKDTRFKSYISDQRFVCKKCKKTISIDSSD